MIEMTRTYSFRHFVLCLIPAIMLVANGITATYADVITLTSAADTYIQRSDTVKAAERDWTKGSLPFADTGRHTPQSRVMRGLIRFDLSDLPEGASITAATLTLHTGLRWDNDGGTPDGEIQVHIYRLLKSWSEGAMEDDYADDGPSWLSAAQLARELWNVPGADGAGTDRAAEPTDTQQVPLHDEAFTSWDVTTDVSDMVAGALENHGWLVVAADEQANGDRVRWTTREKEIASLRPKLTITYEVE